jgi:hypothetical protein
MYSFQEILDLFNIKDSISYEDLKMAKKKVLMLHPDKSKLDSQYFLFYKKAFDIILEFYNEQNKMNVEINNKKMKYEKFVGNMDEKTNKQISKTINKMEKTDFHKKFNEIFEKNMVEKKNTEKNEWFHNHDPLYQYDEPVSKTNMNSTFEKIKTQNNHIVKYGGVKTLHSTNQCITSNYYDEDDDNDEYLTCDPFSKLKYDDLRKVHKDQTIFAVKENDIQNIPTYNSVDQYVQTRQQTLSAPLNEAESYNIIENENKIRREKMLQKEYESKKKSMVYAEKNKSVMSYFLQIGN